MTDSRSSDDPSRDRTLRHPEEWKTGEEPMTRAQRAYLETLSREANVPFDPDEAVSKAEAALRIEELQKRAGRAPG